MDSLARELSTHHAGAEELDREHMAHVDNLREEKTMLEVGVVDNGCGQHLWVESVLN